MPSAVLIQYSKRVTILIVILNIAVGLPSKAFASDPDNVETKLLVSLFPGSRLGAFKSVLGRDSVSEVVSNVTLNGMKGFIPVEKAKAIKLSTSLSVITFPIYLHYANLSQEHLIEVAPDAEPSKVKLVQLIFYNHNDGKVYGKPHGFPLKSIGWTCGGDLCNTVEIVDLESIKNSSTAVVFKYTEGISSHKLRVLAFDGTAVKSSEVFNYGDFGGESGVLASSEYVDLKQVDGEITAFKKDICDRHMDDFCRSVGLMPGSSSRRVHMLNANSR